MTETLWIVVFVQVAIGGFDTLYHHELTERLAWRPSQAGELRLHGVRNLAYAILFATLGWCEPKGAAAVALTLLLFAEFVITLWDFVEEDRTRKLPATERIAHTLLTFNYGVVLCLLAPVLVAWAVMPTAVSGVYHGVWSWLCAIAAIGVIGSGLRDLAAARRTRQLAPGNLAHLAAALRRRHTVLVTGGTGLIGKHLVAALIAAGHDVIVLTHAHANAADLPAPIRLITKLDQIADDARIDAIINLAGEPIATGLWTLRKRQKILRSRLTLTRSIVRVVDRLCEKPSVLVSGSAIGWYGVRGDEPLDESDDGVDCFSRQVCVRWEAAAMGAKRRGVRVVCLRTGLVLTSEGGFLSRLLMPFEFGLGGPFGDGRQWMSWIHRDDVVRLIVHAIATPSVSGPVNATAPAPVTNAAFVAALGHALRRPVVLAIPALPLHLALGAFADELLLGGQRVLPRAALESGFSFLYPEISGAIDAVMGRRSQEEVGKFSLGAVAVTSSHGSLGSH
jgi:uncharacterized protein (TIGR01777 family)